MLLFVFRSSHHCSLSLSLVPVLFYKLRVFSTLSISFFLLMVFSSAEWVSFPENLVFLLPFERIKFAQAQAMNHLHWALLYASEKCFKLFMRKPSFLFLVKHQKMFLLLLFWNALREKSIYYIFCFFRKNSLSSFSFLKIIGVIWKQFSVLASGSGARG